MLLTLINSISYQLTITKHYLCHKQHNAICICILATTYVKRLLYFTTGNS